MKGRRAKFAVAVACVALAGLLAWSGGVPTPTGAADAIVQDAHVRSADPIPLRLATFNIAGGVGRDGRTDLTRTAALLNGFDIVALEEVHGTSIDANQARSLSALVNAGWVFAPAESQWWGNKWFGNGLLSDLPIVQCHRVPISTRQSRSNRNMLVVEATYLGKPLRLVITHLDRHEDHDTELRTVIERFTSLEPPAVLMGDLNATADDAQLRSLRQSPDVSDVLHAMLGDNGVAADNVDWIFVRGLRPTAAGFKDNGASDHHLAWAECLQQ